VADEQTQWFRATNGMVWGVLALVIAAAVIVLDVLGGWHPPVVVGAVLFAALTYVAMIRPRVGVRSDELVLDHMFSTMRIPVAAVDSIAVGRTFEARVAGRSYVSAAVSRSVRQALRGQTVSNRGLRGGGAGESPLRPSAAVEESAGKQHQMSYADFVVERVHASATYARERAGIAEHSPQQAELAARVRRVWAWPEIVGVAVLAVAFVVSFFV
jgi:hypothetical protein